MDCRCLYIRGQSILALVQTKIDCTALNNKVFKLAAEHLNMIQLYSSVQSRVPNCSLVEEND